MCSPVRNPVVTMPYTSVPYLWPKVYPVYNRLWLYGPVVLRNPKSSRYCVRYSATIPALHTPQSSDHSTQQAASTAVDHGNSVDGEQLSKDLHRICDDIEKFVFEKKQCYV